VRKLRLSLVFVGVLAIGLIVGGCGGDGEDETGVAAGGGSEEIVIKTFADLASVTDTGRVLDGSSLGGSPFCPKGTFTGGHDNTDNGWLDHAFECPDGTLSIAFDPRNEKAQSASGPWEVLSGTGAYEGMEGSGRFEIRFPADPDAMEGRETFTGTVSQGKS
jgi:hypothetical protein